MSNETFSHYTILIPEDKFKSLNPLKSFFLTQGFQVISIEDTQAALDMAIEKKPHVIVMNLLGGNINGNEFCIKLYKADPKTRSKVLIVSDLKNKVNIVTAIEAGAADYILRPFKFEDMLNRVQYHLRNIKIIGTKDIAEVLHDVRANVLYEVLEMLATGLSSHDTLYEISVKINKVLPVKRCNIVAGGHFTDMGFVAASNDDPKFECFKLDLNKYPEVRQVLQTGKAVVIEDMANDPIMKDIKKNFNNIDFNSILVLPIKFRNATIGVLSVRASEENKIFAEEEIKICQLLATAAAQALNGWRYVHKDLIAPSESGQPQQA